MEATLVHLEPRQKKRLTRLARRRGKSFSQEVRDAIDLYAELPVDSQEILTVLAAQARAAIDRMIAKSDATIARVDRILKRAERRR